MRLLWNMLNGINKNLAVMIPFCMGLSLVTGHFCNVGILKSLIIPFTFLMVYPMMVNLDFAKIFELGDFKAQLLAQAINFLIIPFFALWIGSLFFADNQFAKIGLLLASLLPTSGMTISWTGFARGNVVAAVKMTVLGLIAGSIATPFYLKWLV